MYKTPESESVRAAVDVFRMDRLKSEMSKSQIKEITRKVRLGIVMGLAAVGLCAAAWFIEDPANMVDKAMSDYNNDRLGQPVVAPGK